MVKPSKNPNPPKSSNPAMDKRPRIEIVVDKHGKVTIEGFNFQGKDCDAAMRELESHMGKEVNRKYKPEQGCVYSNEEIKVEKK